MIFVQSLSEGMINVIIFKFAILLQYIKGYILILAVCMLLRVWDQGEGVFPSTQRYYRRFLLFI
jgi:hypothetical protein